MSLALQSLSKLWLRAPSSQGMVFVRHRRRDCHKLKKPEDKTAIILGHVRKSVKVEKEGISSKTVPIMVEWKKPVMVETCNPQISGDIGGLQHFGQVDLSLPQLEFEKSKHLAEAKDEVKKVLSLEFARNKDVINKLKDTVKKSVEQHPHDSSSLEVRIAGVTISIRNIQRDLIERFPYKNQPVKHRLTHLVSHRHNMLTRLRETDYRKFEWLLEKLNLFYKPPSYDRSEPVARKASVERLTDIWCDELRKHRINNYKRKLEEEQPKFLRKKAEKLAHIMREEKELGLQPSITQEDIDTCLSKADEIEARNVLEEEQEFLVFKEETKKEAYMYQLK